MYITYVRVLTHRASLEDACVKRSEQRLGAHEAISDVVDRRCVRRRGRHRFGFHLAVRGRGRLPSGPPHPRATARPTPPEPTLSGSRRSVGSATGACLRVRCTYLDCRRQRSIVLVCGEKGSNDGVEGVSMLQVQVMLAVREDE